MIYRSPTPDDITSLLEMYGCSQTVIANVIGSISMVETFMKFQPFTSVAAVLNSEVQFFENHVLQDEVSFVDFYNGLLDRLEIKGNTMVGSHPKVDGTGTEATN